jgi:DNA-binding MurR/RpiR family transcriptional regulator
MPASDDDYRAAAIQALIALRADLDRAIDGPRPSREATREIAVEMRGVLERAEKVLQLDDLDQIDTMVARARAKVLEVFGSSGWDATAPPDGLPPLASTSGRKQ